MTMTMSKHDVYKGLIAVVLCGLWVFMIYSCGGNP